MQKLKGRKIKYETKTLKRKARANNRREGKKETANQKSCYGKRRKRRKKKGKRNVPPMAELQKHNAR